MKQYGDEDYLYYLSNKLLLEQQEKEKERDKDFLYIGTEKVNINDKEAFVKAAVQYMNEVISNDK